VGQDGGLEELPTGGVSSTNATSSAGWSTELRLCHAVSRPPSK